MKLIHSGGRYSSPYMAVYVFKKQVSEIKGLCMYKGWVLMVRNLVEN